VNCGNTCFANACLQALAACDPLAAHVGQDLWRGDDESVEQQLLTAPLTRLTGDVFRRIAQGGEAAVQPTELLEHLRFLKPTFVHGSQQDAMECVRTLLDGLHEENKYFVRKRRRIHENDNNLMAAAASSPLAVRSPPHASPLRFASPLSASTNSTVSSPRSPLSRSMPAPVSPSVAEPPEEQSVVACICSGLLLSRVFCLSCENVSDTVDPFTDLPAPIPQEDSLRQQIVVSRKADDRDERAALGLPPSAADVADEGERDEQGWFSYMFSFVGGGTTPTSLTLMDCLYAFFREEKLIGDNQYRCSTCKTLTDANKSYYLLSLPEVLCVHLKRFRHDMYGVAKLDEHVNFPLTQLDLRRFYPERNVRSPLLREIDSEYDRPGGSPPRPNAAPRSNRRPQSTHRDVRAAAADDESAAPYEHPMPGVTYSLSAVIVHIGPFGSGHYIAYARTDDDWYRYDDRRVFRVDASEVQASRGYVLFYSKHTPLAQAPDRGNVLALNDAAAALPDRYWVPAQWWQRWLRLSVEPGTIDNDSLICVHGQLKEWLAHSVPRVVWEQLRDKHGAHGGALRDGVVQRNGERVVRACQRCAQVQALRQHCIAVGAVLLRASLPSTARHFLLPVSWLNQFHRFVSGEGPVPAAIDVPAEVNAAAEQSRAQVAAVSGAFAEWARNALDLHGEPLFVNDLATFRMHFRQK
jgi:ubiquitin carboxyl-terminal hydrolase 20/33